jgi:anti-anti-sigma factor
MEPKAPLGSFDLETNTLVLSGEWDFSMKDELQLLTDRLSGDEATVDLKDATFIDSSVINTIVRTHKRLYGNGGRLRLVTGGGHIAKLLNVTGLDRVMEIDGRTP